MGLQDLTTVSGFDPCFLWKGGEKFQRDGEGGLVGPLCSRNPHDETVVVRRAQWWSKPGHRPREGTNERGGKMYPHRIALIDSLIGQRYGYTVWEEYGAKQEVANPP